MFKLSKKSNDRLEEVDERLAEVVRRAIEITNIDFAVSEGLRTVERQRQLVRAGASQTMASKHIEGRAVDLVAFIDDRVSWELNLYDDIADAVRQAAIDVDVGIRWGGAWHIDDIREWDSTMQDALDDYVDSRRAVGKRPFIDGPHFELSDDND